MNLIERVKNIIIDPKKEWEVIAGENDTLQNVIIKYVLPLAAIGAVCTFIGYAFLGNVFGMGWAIKTAVIAFISSVVGVIITSFVVDALAPSFGSEKNLNKSAQLVAYGYTPAFVGALLSIIPILGIIGSLFGLYGIYLMYLGLGPMKKTPEDKKVVYLLVTIAILIGVYIVLGVILGLVLLTGGATNLLR
jgi:Yip1 domain